MKTTKTTYRKKKMLILRKNEDILGKESYELRYRKIILKANVKKTTLTFTVVLKIGKYERNLKGK